MSKKTHSTKTPKTRKASDKGLPSHLARAAKAAKGKTKAESVASLAGPTQEQAQAAAEAVGQAPQNAPGQTPTTTLDAGGGIMVDVVETTPETPATKTKKAPKEPKAKKPSGLDLVAQVLKEKGEPMNAKDIADAVIAAGWQTKGKTPAATLYSAMLREIDGKPGESRFVKTGRGLFALTGKN